LKVSKTKQGVMVDAMSPVRISSVTTAVAIDTPDQSPTDTEEEGALDQTLADSFPASDPPPWTTLGVTRTYSEPHAIAPPTAAFADTLRDECTATVARGGQ
jgi:hypothetical protein